MFFLSNNFFGSFFMLPSFYFFILKNKLLIFFFINNFFFKSFLSHFKNLYIGFYFFFFFKYKLRGLGYRVKNISSRLLRFFIGTTNFFYMHIPYFIFAKAKRRRLLLFSFNYCFLKIIFLYLSFLKKLIPYKLRGFFFPRQLILMKPGKKRF
jgi:hypothetical protein